jgi:CHAD domain-containing protein
MARPHAIVQQPPAVSADDDARAAARRVLAMQVAMFEHEAPAAARGDVEAIHQLRVATRRLRTSLQLFAPMLPPATAGSLAEGLSWLGRGVGGVRDLDVLALAVSARARGLADETRAALGPLEHDVSARRAVALAELVRMRDTPQCRRMLGRLGQLAASRPAVRGAVRFGDVAADLVRPMFRSVVRAGRDMHDGTPGVALHRLRVRVKRLRYACEALAPLVGDDMRPVVRRLMRLQDVLGEHQDAVTQVAWLRAYAGSAQLPPATLLATGALVDRLDRRARRLRVRIPRAWRRFDRGRTRRTLGESLRVLRAPPARATPRRKPS